MNKSIAALSFLFICLSCNKTDHNSKLIVGNWSKYPSEFTFGFAHSYWSFSSDNKFSEYTPLAGGSSSNCDMDTMTEGPFTYIINGNELNIENGSDVEKWKIVKLTKDKLYLRKYVDNKLSESVAHYSRCD